MITALNWARLIIVTTLLFMIFKEAFKLEGVVDLLAISPLVVVAYFVMDILVHLLAGETRP